MQAHQAVGLSGCRSEMPMSLLAVSWSCSLLPEGVHVALPVVAFIFKASNWVPNFPHALKSKTASSATSLKPVCVQESYD